MNNQISTSTSPSPAFLNIPLSEVGKPSSSPSTSCSRIDEYNICMNKASKASANCSTLVTDTPTLQYYQCQCQSYKDQIACYDICKDDKQMQLQLPAVKQSLASQCKNKRENSFFYLKVLRLIKCNDQVNYQIVLDKKILNLTSKRKTFHLHLFLNQQQHRIQAVRIMQIMESTSRLREKGLEMGKGNLNCFISFFS